MRDDPARRVLASYPHRHEIRARFGDMDSFQHVNNVVLARYHEDARVDFLRSVIGSTASRGGTFHFLVAELRISYLSEVEYPGTYQVGVGVSRIGSTSVVLATGLFAGDRCLGLGDTTLVHMTAAGSTPVPAARRALLAESALAGVELSVRLS